jgi:acetyl esterase/lipase
LGVGPALANTASQPTQPKAGPGGKDYAYSRTLATGYGEGEKRYWVIEPDRAGDKPLPVVLFAHGMGLTNHSAYRSWINHLVRRGNIVIYPSYHASGIVDPKTFTRNTAQAVREALKRCDGKQHRLADTDRFTMIGHSLGGTIIANLAARPDHFGLPKPDALMLLQPGDTRADKGLGALFPKITEDHSTIPKGTLMLIVDVENDYFVSPKAGQRIVDNAEQIAADDKRRLLLRSDDHGEQPIIADHMLPMAWTTDQSSQGRVNAYDHALWRWFDALQATAHGDDTQRELVFGDAALDVGRWSDDTPVRPPVDTSAK